MADHLTRVDVSLKYRTTSASCEMRFVSNVPGVKNPQSPTQTLAHIAAECARLVAIDGSETEVLDAVQDALRKVREWRERGAA